MILALFEQHYCSNCEYYPLYYKTFSSCGRSFRAPGSERKKISAEDTVRQVMVVKNAKEKFKDDLPDMKAKDVQDATVKIQAVFRGYQARRENAIVARYSVLNSLIGSYLQCQILLQLRNFLQADISYWYI